MVLQRSGCGQTGQLRLVAGPASLYGYNNASCNNSFALTRQSFSGGSNMLLSYYSGPE